MTATTGHSSQSQRAARRYRRYVSWTVAEQGNPSRLAEQLRAAPEVASVVVADGQHDRDLTDEPVTMHPGIVPGVGDLGQQFAWGDAGVKITLQRVE